jgi:hypothetical protein
VTRRTAIDIGSISKRFTALRFTRLRDGRYDAAGVFPAPADGGLLRLELSWQEGAGWGGEVLERIPESERWRPDAGALEAYAGTFHSPDLDVPWELVVGDGPLLLRRRRSADHALTPVEPDVMTGVLGTYERPVYIRLHFVRDAAGAVTYFGVSTPPGQDAIRELRFDRVAAPAPESMQ